MWAGPAAQARPLTAFGVGRKAGEAVAVDIGETQLGIGGGRSLRTISRIPVDQVPRSGMPVISATQAPGRSVLPVS